MVQIKKVVMNFCFAVSVHLSTPKLNLKQKTMASNTGGSRIHFNCNFCGPTETNCVVICKKHIVDFTTKEQALYGLLSAKNEELEHNNLLIALLLCKKK